ncbi:DHH family phosphoesterase [Mycoplasma tauri]|uniref:DHH family phosphoesterase n=1 Tax=Mycoplasma tauri TaxID=547987 RepID=UPI001CBF5A4E|nr:bifunctional oligoribonuclease/PAP phosphatase NrnA [Mycoplasma tauri]
MAGNMVLGKWNDAKELIEKYDSIVIFHHVRPDGDCLGSQFGLRELIRENYPNKNVYAIGDNGGSLSFMNFQFDEVPSDEILKKSLGIVVDGNGKERLFLREVLDKNLFPQTLRIDHHPNGDDLDNCTRWVESARIAAAEMIAELAYQCNWKISPKAAEFIFLGMVTDSGCFQFSDTSHRTHELAALLYKTGMNAEKIFLGLAQKNIEDLKVNLKIFENLKTDGKVAYSTITYKETLELGKKPNEVCRVNLIGNLKGYPFWVLFNEEENGKIRVEYRSIGPCVRNVAVKYGGGGHERASGSILDSFSMIQSVINDCNAEVDRWEKYGNEDQVK